MIIDPKLISWQANVGIIEASDVRNDHGSWTVFQITSPRTKETKSFHWATDVRDDEGDLMYEVYKTPCGRFELRVLND